MTILSRNWFARKMLSRARASAIAFAFASTQAHGSGSLPAVGTTGTFPTGNADCDRSDCPAAVTMASGGTVSESFPPHQIDTVEAFNYGCASVVNNPVADAAACIQATFNRAAALRRCAHFPGATYYIHSNVTVPSTLSCVRGDGLNPQNGGVGSNLHIVSAAFMTGGAYAGRTPFNVPVNNGLDVSGFTFTEDVAPDSPSATRWTPNDYGYMWSIQNSKLAKFHDINVYGVNKFADLVSTNGFWTENVSAAIFTRLYQIDANTDYLHAAHIHHNNFYCGGGSGRCPNAAAYTQANGVLFNSLRDDNPTFEDVNGFGLFAAFQFGSQTSGYATGNTSKFKITDVDCDHCAYTIRVTANGTTGQADNVVGQHNGYGKRNEIIPGSRTISIESSSNTIQLGSVRSTYAGDSAVAISSGTTGNRLSLSSLFAESWGSAAQGGAACNTVYALSPGSTAQGGNVVTLGSATTTTGCSTLVTPPILGFLAGGLANGASTEFVPELKIGDSTAGIMTSHASGVCTQIFHHLSCQVVVTLSSKGSNTGGVTIANIPQRPDGISWGSAGGGVCTSAANMTGLSSAIIVQAPAAANYINLLQYSATGTTALTDANLTNTAQLKCEFDYLL